MMWYSGEIFAAIQESKRSQKIFVVYIEGKDEMSKEMTASFENSAEVQQLLKDECVSIKIASDSDSCQNFNTFYPVAVVPSSYFIGTNGVPLEVVAGSLGPEELKLKITKVIETHKANLAKSQPKNDVVKESPKNDAVQTPNKQQEEATLNAGASTSSVSNENVEEKLGDKVERAKQIIEVRREQKLREEMEQEKAKELERMQMGKAMQKQQRLRQDQELEELAQQRKKQKEEEKLARKRVLDQIAQDRADRAAKFKQHKSEEVEADKAREDARLRAEQERAAAEAQERSQFSRIQFRLPDGSFTTHIFPADATLNEVIQFVRQDVYTSSPAFTLSTAFPRRAYGPQDHAETLRNLSLAPSAVLLVLPEHSLVSSVTQPSWFYNILLSLISPFLFLWRFVSDFLFRGPPTNPDGSAVPPRPSRSAPSQRQ